MINHRRPGASHPASGPRFEQFQQVAVATDRFVDEGAPRGTIGYILEIYFDPPGYEIEVSDPRTGHTIALFSAAPDEVEEPG